MKVAFVFNRQNSKTIEQAEFDTDETIGAIHQALESGGHQVFDLEMTSSERWIQELRRVEPDIIFNTAEGFRGVGRESLGPIIFEQLGIPYVGPGPYVCFLTLDKYLTKQVVAQRDVPIAEGYFVAREKELFAMDKNLVYPVFVKPNYEGSSKGITAKSICRNAEEFLSYSKECLKQFPEGILIEKFVTGKDISVGYIAGVGESGILDPIEYVVKNGSEASLQPEWIYDFDYKNLRDDCVSVRCPADLDPTNLEKIKKNMEICVEALGVVDFGRADFRVTPEGEVFFLEFNALPSLQKGAGIFKATQQVDLDYNQKIGFQFFQMKIDLENLLNTRVDLVSSTGLSEYIKQKVEKEKQLIYAR